MTRPGGPLVRLIRLMMPYGHVLVAGLVCTAFAGLSNLAVYWVVKELIDRVLSGPDVAARAHMLNLIVVGILVLFFLKGIVSYGQVYLMAFVGHRVVADLRENVYGHLQRMSLGFHESRRRGEMISRVTNDVAIVQVSVASGIAELLSQIVMLGGIIGLMFYLDWKLSLTTFALMPVVATVVGRAGSKLRTITGLIQSKIADVTSVLQETLAGIRIVKAFTMEAHEMERFRRENEGNFDAAMKGAKVNAAIAPLVEFLAVVGLAAVLWYGGRQVISGRLTLGGFMAFLGAVGTLPTPLGRLSATYGAFQQALGAADRIFALLDAEPEAQDSLGAVNLPPTIEGRIDFVDVYFAYHVDEPVLSGINLTVAPGEVVALVGPSGAGKTTLINLIPRFYDPCAGSVLIDGYDVRKVRLSSLRRQIGLVPQETILFSVSVAENIAYGRPGASEREVVEAARLANAHEFIMRLPNGYHTLLGERGVALSGGQRQRIAIARALLRNPRILILDEATSSLDPESEAQVQEALSRLFRNRTTLIIAHRLSTVRMADRILVLDGGKIVEEGTYEELLAKGGLYARLSSARFGEDQVV